MQLILLLPFKISQKASLTSIDRQ
uniref:Uncharacterized protein n=1 Tax=Arundo donax TaxID=35708 RepID=A0A0A9ED04_ARUDO